MKLSRAEKVERVEKVLAKLKSTERDVVRIEILEGTTNLTESKFGGLPYLPIGATIPQDEGFGRSGNLYMIAQFNLSELPANSFPIATGILQFWIAGDEDYGIDITGDCDSQKHSRVIYYPIIETHFSEEELKAKYTPRIEGDDFPITSTFKLKFIKEREIITTSDIAFNDKFVDIWNELYQDDIEAYYDIEQGDDDLFDDIEGAGHKLLGYGYYEPHYEDFYEDYILLFQMDSDHTFTSHIMWGDLGRCHFFIKEEDLKDYDFSKVLYIWSGG